MNEFFLYGLYSLLSLTLIIASFYDHKKRSIWYLLFVPVFIAAAFINVYFYGFIIFTLFSVLLFLCLFTATSTRFYVAAYGITASVGTMFIIFSNSYSLIPWMVEVIFSGMVIGERLFGVGDIKAILAVIFSLAPEYETFSYSTVHIPSSIIFFLNLGITSVCALIFSLFYTFMVTGVFSYSAEVGESDHVDTDRFRIFYHHDKRYVSYKIPFTIFITGAFFITLVSLKLSLLI